MTPVLDRYLFIGLGNPGDPYTQSRHNAGWMALDQLIQLWHDPTIPPRWRTEKKIQAEVLRMQRNSQEYFFVKPQTYMNESGQAAAAAVKWYLEQDPSESNQKFKQVIVLHDDLDIEVGAYKLQFGSGPKVHNGVNSVRNHLNSDQFWSARLGVDGRQGDRSIPGHAYVLQAFQPTEKTNLKEAIQTLSEELPYTVLR